MSYGLKIMFLKCRENQIVTEKKWKMAPMWYLRIVWGVSTNAISSLEHAAMSDGLSC